MNNGKESKRNIGYVLRVVNEHPDGLCLRDLTRLTRLAHSTNYYLGLDDAKKAIKIAIEQGLIKEEKRDWNLRFYLPVENNPY